LLQLDRRREAGRAGTDHDHVEFHRFARREFPRSRSFGHKALLSLPLIPDEAMIRLAALVFQRFGSTERILANPLQP
jgi:hypothetical protein